MDTLYQDSIMAKKLQDKKEEFLAMSLSEAIRLSVEECERIESIQESQKSLPPSAQIKLNMGAWLDRDDKGTCYACMAGVVLKGMLKPLNYGEGIDPYSIPPAVRVRVYALNAIRVGDVLIAINSWGYVPVPETLSHSAIADWEERAGKTRKARGVFEWEYYRELADILEKAGM